MLYTKINVKSKRFLFLTSCESPLNKGGSEGVWKYRWLRLIPFSFVKIAHHSSVTGYCPKFWEEDVVTENLVGVTTIFKTSKGENLP